MPTTANSGDLEILPQGAAFGSTATMVYVSNLQFNTVSTAAKINTANDQISVQVRGGGANVAIDVVGYFKSAADATAMNFNVNGERVMRYEFKPESPNVIGGSPSNVAGAFYAQTIAGGGLAGDACYDPPSGTFTRHCGNSAANVLATVGGGAANVASGEQSTVAGGIKNTASGFSGTVGGGQENTAGNSDATIAGGAENTASGFDATVAGGEHNVASGFWATVLGGEFNTAQGQFSVAMGALATAFHDYSVVWNGWSSGISAGSFRPHVFQVHADNGLDVEYGAPRADGGGTSWVWISNGIAGQAIATSTGGFLSTGGVWTNNSDRARKADLRPVDPQTILDKVVRLPVSSWQYTAEDAEVRHVGPMAQDFYAAFGLGPSEKSIATVDAEGIALAAIQGLHQLVHEKDAKIEAQKREIADLRDRLLQVEHTLLRLTTGDGRVAMHPTP